MLSVTQYRKILNFEIIDQVKGCAYGYYVNHKGIKLYRQLKFKIINGKIEIGKPDTIKKSEYETLLDRYGIGRTAKFNELQEILN